MDVLVSVVMPVYNVERYIKAAVLSVLNQTYQNFEVIIVNDGTKDNSLEVVNSLVKDDNRIKIVNRENGGLSAARNTGLKECSGKYVLFMDSDDTIQADLLEKTVQVAEVEGSEIVAFGYNILNCNFENEIISKEDVEFDSMHYEHIVKAKNIPSCFFGAIGFAWNKLYKRSYLIKNKFEFEEGTSLIEDIVFNESVFCGTQKISFIKGAYYNYFVRPRKTLSNMYYDNAFEMHKRGFTCRTQVVRYLYENAENLDNMFAENYFNGFRFCCSNIFKYQEKNGFSKKYRALSIMIKDEETKRQIKNYKATSNSGKLIKYCIKHNLNILLYLLYSIRFK